MATGMFRTDDGSVQVDYDGNNIPIPRSKNEENGYKPAFDELPLEADYWAADFDIVTASRANCCPRKNFASAASCSDEGLRSSLACSGTFSPPKCSAFIARHYLMARAR
jgi:hypothetical protein